MTSSSVESLLIVFGSLCVVISHGSYELRIKPVGDKFVRSLSSSMVFTCEVCDIPGNGEDRSEGVIKIQWLDQNRREITNNNKRIFIENDGTRVRKLYITKIENRDAGLYTCFVTVGTFTDERSVELVLFKDITFDHAPNPQHPAIHTDALIECQVSGIPIPDISWKYNGYPIDLGGKFTKEMKGLKIKNISRADNGNYTCRAEVDSEGRYDDRRIVVIVHVPPKVTQGPGNQVGVAGQELSLYCKAEGDPMPSFEFLKNNKEKLLTTSASDRVQADSQLGKLTFRSLKKEDEGQYTCKALNDVGEDFQSGSLKIQVPPHINELRNVTVSEGQTATLTCKSHGDPTPDMTFQKFNHQDYKLGSNDADRVVVLKKSLNILELTIKRASAHDMSLYTCKSQNDVGEDSAQGHITVLYKPKFAGNHTKEVHSWVGRHHNITCHAHAFPHPTFQWMRYDRILTNNDSFHIFTSSGNTSLQIRVKEADQSWIFGEYICRATNSKGSTDLTIMLNKAFLPDAPVEVHLVENTPNMVTLNVLPPRSTGGVGLVGYRVEYDHKVFDYNTLGRGSHSSNTTHSRNENEIRIENLKPGNTYVFKIRAKNEVGAGSYFEYGVTTLNLTKPYPIKVTSSRQGKDAWGYKLMWDKPKSGGKPIKEYEIKYKKVRVKYDGSIESLEEWKIEKKKETVYKPSLEHNFHHLNPKTEYQVEIVAKTDLGSSGLNEKFVFKTAAEHYRAGPYQGSSNSIRLSLLLLIFLQLFLSYVNLDGISSLSGSLRFHQ